MNFRKFLLQGVLCVVFISCGDEENVTPEEESQNPSEIITNATNTRAEECKTVLEGLTNANYHIYVLNRSYDECLNLTNDDIRFYSTYQPGGEDNEQVFGTWTSNFDVSDSLIFIRQGKRYDHTIFREKLSFKTIIYLTKDENGRYGYRVNYVNIGECESQYIKLENDEIRLTEDGEC